MESKNYLSVRIITITLVLTSLITVFRPVTAQDDNFHFTVTSDMRRYHKEFGNVLQAIKDGPGYGAFHVSIGDFDETAFENRAQIDNKFGSAAIWYPIIGNHEADTMEEMDWLRNEYHNGNSSRMPLKHYTNQDGPRGSLETTYSWDYGNAHFIALNQYWDGTTAPSSDVGTDGDIMPELYEWLVENLAANTKPFVFIFGHEPAFPNNRNLGSSLDKYLANRDSFWSLLEVNGVHVYFCAHTHYYSKHRGNENLVGNVWQLDAGNVGNDPGDGFTYFDVIVGSNEVEINVYRDNGTGSFSLVESVQGLLWESYSDSTHNNQCNHFYNYYTEHKVHMFGTGFNPNHDYRISFYDGSNSNVFTESKTSDTSGNIASWHTFKSGTDTSGIWNVVVSEAAYVPPDTYIATWPYIVVSDTFEVRDTAIRIEKGIVGSVGVAFERLEPWQRWVVIAGLVIVAVVAGLVSYLLIRQRRATKAF